MSILWINRILALVFYALCIWICEKYKLSPVWCFFLATIWIFGMGILFEFIKGIIE